jgi:hypothetical protein
MGFSRLAEATRFAALRESTGIHRALDDTPPDAWRDRTHPRLL